MDKVTLFLNLSTFKVWKLPRINGGTLWRQLLSGRPLMRQSSGGGRIFYIEGFVSCNQKLLSPDHYQEGRAEKRERMKINASSREHIAETDFLPDKILSSLFQSKERTFHRASERESTSVSAYSFDSFISAEKEKKNLFEGLKVRKINTLNFGNKQSVFKNWISYKLRKNKYPWLYFWEKHRMNNDDAEDCGYCCSSLIPIQSCMNQKAFSLGPWLVTVNRKVGPSKSKSMDINNYNLKLKPEHYKLCFFCKRFTSDITL